MRRAGKSLREIADEYGVQPHTVVNALNQVMKLQSTLVSATERSAVLQMEADRLDALQAAHWDAALYGDVKSTELVLKVMAHRARLMGLDKVDAETQQNTVLVVGGNEREYIQALLEAEGRSAGTGDPGETGQGE